MITYLESTYESRGASFTLATPVLHKVCFNHYDRTEVMKWCEQNCKAKFYPGPSWAGHFFEFEDDEDAVWFALRWA